MNKYCKNCGTENKDNSKFCPNCGAAMSDRVEKTNTNATNNIPNNKTNSMALAGFITALISLILNFWGIVGIVATILSGVGLSKTSDGTEKGKGLAIAGLIIGIFSIIYGVIQIIILSNYFN